ncbi:hypothetical protein CC1G_01520 [Coprinopsis cinerea okayama7|uniref:Ubiquinol-cytochrome C reductase hinge domain-containing protein n=1 Tax=Coprinopsis cinerea (strain Okayama-7 / 130 / ATCC MYA-4618 / FGSC 9003) TaxID=240176 RepID=A8NHW4_COPC7|nr:hypothetical protein CC1G_01520 [Coprinopsis cinerea okayama7\|eukprot:XP_001833843.2 hypothetical protein CC1G_01520 [Coprinopsis cinerea okayama7\
MYDVPTYPLAIFPMTMGRSAYIYYLLPEIALLSKATRSATRYSRGVLLVLLSSIHSDPKSFNPPQTNAQTLKQKKRPEFQNPRTPTGPSPHLPLIEIRAHEGNSPGRTRDRVPSSATQNRPSSTSFPSLSKSPSSSSCVPSAQRSPKPTQRLTDENLSLLFLLIERPEKQATMSGLASFFSSLVSSSTSAPVVHNDSDKEVDAEVEVVEQEEEEEEPEDVHPAIREECKEQKCAQLAKHFEACQEKVNAGEGFKGEDCVEEMFQCMSTFPSSMYPIACSSIPARLPSFSSYPALLFPPFPRPTSNPVLTHPFPTGMRRPQALRQAPLNSPPPRASLGAPRFFRRTLDQPLARTLYTRPDI